MLPQKKNANPNLVVSVVISTHIGTLLQVNRVIRFVFVAHADVSRGDKSSIQFLSLSVCLSVYTNG